MVRKQFDDIVIDCPENTPYQEWNLGFILGELQGGVYSKYPVKGLDVLDIGGYLGETAIWFERQGAKRVIVAEPFDSYAYLIDNLKNNNAQRVTPLRVAISDQRGWLTVTDDGNSTGGNNVWDHSTETGVKVEQWLLADFVANFDLNGAILKMDCEGSEFPAILGASLDTLRHFNAIMMEVHAFAGDPQTIVAQLGAAGFQVEIEVVDSNKIFMLYASLASMV